MKIVIGGVLALALMVSVTPATASDTFHALSTLPTLEQASLTPLPDDQLAAVEGGAFRRAPILSVNIAVLPQINVCVICKDVAQTNIGLIAQGIRFRR
jgi:hypothetical protein